MGRIYIRLSKIIFKFLRDKSGVSFQELLLVITIVGFLIGLLSVGYISQLRKGRDAQRKAHIQKIKTALEEYFNDHGCYPDNDSFFDIDYCDANPADFDFLAYLRTAYREPFGECYQVLTDNSDDRPSWYAIYTNIEYPKDIQLLANECSAGCEVNGKTYNFVVYSEGLASAQVPGVSGAVCSYSGPCFRMVAGECNGPTDDPCPASGDSGCYSVIGCPEANRVLCCD